MGAATRRPFRAADRPPTPGGSASAVADRGSIAQPSWEHGLRLPFRTRGVAAGLAVLAVGPIVALSGGHAGVLTSEASDAVVTGVSSEPALHLARFDAPRDPMVRDPEPTATPAPPPPPAPPAPAAAKPKPVVPALPPPAPGSIEAIIAAAAAKYGVSYSWMFKIAACESGLRPTAYNPSGPYEGLYQFLPSTFYSHARLQGIANPNIWDPAQQADITANMLAHGQASAWSCA